MVGDDGMEMLMMVRMIRIGGGWGKRWDVDDGERWVVAVDEGAADVKRP